MVRRLVSFGWEDLEPKLAQNREYAKRERTRARGEEGKGRKTREGGTSVPRSRGARERATTSDPSAHRAQPRS